MKKWYQSLKHQPRSVRAVLNLVLLALVMLLFYISIGSPAFTPEQQFRKEEKAHLVGPAKILDTISLDNYTGYNPCNRLILATSDEGVTLFQYDDKELEQNKLVYRKKMGDVTVLSFPGIRYSVDTATYVRIPIILFDSFPEAVRAKMEIELIEKYSDETEFQKVYTLESERDVNGYFLFTLSASNSEQLGREGRAIWQLTNISDDNPFDTSVEVAFPITIRFYDQENNVICERSLVLRSPAGEAYASGMGNRS